MAQLILQDGTKFEGEMFGANVHSQGEVVFNTGMVGYPQSITDPSYCGQILTFTYPLIGNYGVPDDSKDKYGILKHFESDQIRLRGIVVSEYSKNAFHWEKKRTLHQWLKENNIPGICGIDTRALTQKLRSHGVMLGQIVPDKHTPFKNLADPNKENLVSTVSIKKPKIYKGGRKTVVLIDCGMKNNILRDLLKRNLTVIRVPWNYNFFELDKKWDGILISNGPGDPMQAGETVHLISRAIKEKIPTFGICIGMQLIALATGGKTYKLKFGHRAQNQPVTDLETGKCYLTSQNHGYAVDDKKMSEGFEIWMRNTNDNTVEGIKHKKLPVFAVQFHPEATPGPIDTAYIFDKFIDCL